MASMQAEVYSTVKPISPARTIVLAFLLLVFTGMLAMNMSQSRTKTANTMRIRPDQWDISFLRPKGFNPGDIEHSEIGQSITSELLFHDGVKIELTVWRLPISTGTNPAQPSESLMRWLQTKSSWSLNRFLQLGQPPIKPVAERLGSLDAYELLDHRISTVVRVGVLSDRLAYGVSMSIHGMELGQSLYSTFDRTCRSITLESN